MGWVRRLRHAISFRQGGSALRPPHEAARGEEEGADAPCYSPCTHDGVWGVTTRREEVSGFWAQTG